jgi:SAM-dependent methyltransferase
VSTSASEAPGSYPGGELALFEKATRWKRYLGRALQPHLRGEVLEVGAGRGGTTGFLVGGEVTSWCCLEPDPELRAEIDRKIADGELPGICRSAEGGLEDLGADLRFDAILYVDVLEHIGDDRAEVALAAGRLRPGGVLAALGPAHPRLFSPFDEAIGHHRRYRLRDLQALRPPGWVERAGGYLDAAGLLVSLGNRVLLRSAEPTAAQIALWDRWLVPVSERLDGLLGHRVGKSVYVVWQKPADPATGGPAR